MNKLRKGDIVKYFKGDAYVVCFPKPEGSVLIEFLKPPGRDMWTMGGESSQIPDGYTPKGSARYDQVWIKRVEKTTPRTVKNYNIYCLKKSKK